MKQLDNSIIRNIATAVLAAVDNAEEQAYSPFDGDSCRFAIDTDLDLDDSMGLSGHVAGDGTAWYATDGDGYCAPVTTETIEKRFNINAIELWDSETDEPVENSLAAQVTALLDEWYPNGKITA